MGFFLKKENDEKFDRPQKHVELAAKLVDVAVSSGCSYLQIKKAAELALDYLEHSTYPAYRKDQYGRLVTMSGEKPLDQHVTDEVRL